MKYSSQGMCAVFCHYNAKKNSFKPCLHSVTVSYGKKSVNSVMVLQQLNLAGVVSYPQQGFPLLRRGGLSRHKTVAPRHGFSA